jgi:hypothetical protein
MEHHPRNGLASMLTLPKPRSLCERTLVLENGNIMADSSDKQ